MIEINVENDVIDFKRIKRILVIKLQHLGDVLLTTPIYSVLKQQYPHVEIDALIYQETAVMLDSNPYVHRVYTIDRKWKAQGVMIQAHHEYQLFKQLHENEYGLIINLTDRWRGAWITRILNPTYSVSLPYQHRRGKFWRKSFTHIYRISKYYRHTVEKNLDAIRRLGLHPKEDQKKLTFITSRASEEKIRQLLSKQARDQQVIVIHPTSRWMFKAWNPEGFAQVIDALKDAGHCVVVISGPAEKEVEYVEAILHKVRNSVINLSGQLSLNETGALIKFADCFLGLDSVAMHVAAAVNTPCVALFGPTTDKVWSPWKVSHKVLTEDFTCRPCGLKGCGDSMISDCLQALRPKDVFDAVLQTMLKP
ncbi:putative lipopolysaccharide heptosyltransferase III [Methylomarinum sp. Ch1-1]|uniref:Lipopolysaccharide heptosyltransferase III n=1 Tax=Methylomarinum roseum TaxID=3067653 RepID=A0AAU7NVK9_9GAMM|nr:putative lipopolysaccharide heptosyltransferase III [Methylomarinum sp. Ch1-1]MDP4522935.1 putative lipopolysaccharide heptosyltransferase III [Methylomarinum sp. Ch1-1]